MRRTLMSENGEHDGQLTGFAGGLDTKAQLLALEGQQGAR
jgi:hypothetical protein